jgi:hypothetical protein
MRRRGRKETTYGQKGGEGPTRGKKSTLYEVTFPGGGQHNKRVFKKLKNPTGYAYMHDGKWYVATVDEPNVDRFSHYTQCPALELT